MDGAECSMAMDQVDYRSIPMRREDEEHVYCVDNLVDIQHTAIRRNKSESAERKSKPSKAFIAFIAFITTIAVLALLISIITLVILFQTKSANQDNVSPTQMHRSPNILLDEQFSSSKGISNNAAGSEIDSRMTVMASGISDQIKNLTATFGRLEDMVHGQGVRLLYVEADLDGLRKMDEGLTKRITELNESSDQLSNNINDELQKMQAITMRLLTLIRQSQNQNATKQYVSAVENKLISLIHNMGLNVSVLKNQVEENKDSIVETKAKASDIQNSVYNTAKQLRSELRSTKRGLDLNLLSVSGTLNDKYAALHAEMKNLTVRTSKYMEVTSFFWRNVLSLRSEMRSMKANFTDKLDKVTTAYNNISQMLSENGIGRKIENPVRLVSGDSRSGRVEVFHNGEWGTICDDGWDLQNADVICRMLGFPRAISAPRNSHFGGISSTVKIWLDRVKCKGTEARISDCSHKGWGKHNCDHTEDASVVCMPKPV